MFPVTGRGVLASHARAMDEWWAQRQGQRRHDGWPGRSSLSAGNRADGVDRQAPAVIQSDAAEAKKTAAPTKSPGRDTTAASCAD